MKRTLLMAVASSVLALAAPSVASAHHAKHHHSSRHKHHASARLFRFGTFGTAFGPTSRSGSTQTSAPTSPSGEPAGTVASFTGGLLTITLKDGSTVSGKVTEQTELECSSATAPTSTQTDDQGGGDDEGGRDSGENGGPAGGQPVAHESSDDQQSGDDDQGEDEGGSSSCTTAALVPGAVVGEAELSVSGAGAVWKKVELIQ
jgi:hypothetical protein